MLVDGTRAKGDLKNTHLKTYFLQMLFCSFVSLTDVPSSVIEQVSNGYAEICDKASRLTVEPLSGPPVLWVAT